MKLRWAGIYEQLDREGVVDNLDFAVSEAKHSQQVSKRVDKDREVGVGIRMFAAGHPRAWNQSLPGATPERFRLPIALILKHPVSIRPIRVNPRYLQPLWLTCGFFYSTYSLTDATIVTLGIYPPSRCSSIFFRFIRYDV